jgi:hypothetical protein
MGCGCKNKENQQNQLNPQQIQEIERRKAESSANVKETIKKTVEKYYSKNNPQ